MLQKCRLVLCAVKIPIRLASLYSNQWILLSISEQRIPVQFQWCILSAFLRGMPSCVTHPFPFLQPSSACEWTFCAALSPSHVCAGDRAGGGAFALSPSFIFLRSGEALEGGLRMSSFSPWPSNWRYLVLVGAPQGITWVLWAERGRFLALVLGRVASLLRASVSWVGGELWDFSDRPAGEMAVAVSRASWCFR